MSEQLNEAALLLGVGMLVVFLFLSILILGIKGITYFVRLTTPLLPPNHAGQDIHASTQLASSKAVPPEIVAAIAIAVHQHKQQSK